MLRLEARSKNSVELTVLEKRFENVAGYSTMHLPESWSAIGQLLLVVGELGGGRDGEGGGEGGGGEGGGEGDGDIEDGRMP